MGDGFTVHMWICDRLRCTSTIFMHIFRMPARWRRRRRHQQYSTAQILLQLNSTAMQCELFRDDIGVVIVVAIVLVLFECQHSFFVLEKNRNSILFHSMHFINVLKLESVEFSLRLHKQELRCVWVSELLCLFLGGVHTAWCTAHTHNNTYLTTYILLFYVKWVFFGLRSVSKEN